MDSAEARFGDNLSKTMGPTPAHEAIWFLVKQPFLAMKHGEILEGKVTRNPLVWIPFLLIAPAALLLYWLIIFPILALVVLPMIVVSDKVYFRRWRMDFTDEGVRFGKANGNAFVRWEEVGEVERKEGISYTFRLHEEKGGVRELTAVDFRCNEELESLIAAKRILLRLPAGEKLWSETPDEKPEAGEASEHGGRDAEHRT